MIKSVSLFFRNCCLHRRLRRHRIRLSRLYGFKLYEIAVVDSRCARLFVSGYVPDTVDGRLDLLTLHLYLYTGRFSLRFDLVIRSMMEFFVRDLDSSLREMGTGDLSVGKKVRNILMRVYGAFDAYRLSNSPSDWHNVLSRNIPNCDSVALNEYRIQFSSKLSSKALYEVVGRCGRLPSSSNMRIKAQD